MQFGCPDWWLGSFAYYGYDHSSQEDVWFTFTMSGFERLSSDGLSCQRLSCAPFLLIRALCSSCMSAGWIAGAKKAGKWNWRYYDSSHKYYNFLESDWSITLRSIIVHMLVIGHLNWHAAFIVWPVRGVIGLNLLQWEKNNGHMKHRTKSKLCRVYDAHIFMNS